MPDPYHFSRKTNNLIASFRGLPRDTSRAFWKKEKSLDSVMDKVIERYQLGTTRREEIIAAEWISLVGEYNAQHAQPIRLDRHQRLYVAVNNPVVKQEMLFRKKLILTRLRKIKNCDDIRDIVFRAG